VADKLEARSQISKIELLDSQILRISREDNGPIVVATIASTKVTADEMQELFKLEYQIDFVVNVPKEAYWTGGAIRAVTENAVAFGGLGDLHRAIGMSDPNKYVNPEFAFVERGLRQHTKVEGLQRLHDRKYVVQRLGRDDVVVVLLNEYELTADHVRTAGDRYGEFGDILITNPNGRATASATQAAKYMGASIYKWREFLGRLNRK
jgi:hypothetical protein